MTYNIHINKVWRKCIIEEIPLLIRLLRRAAVYITKMIYLEILKIGK